MLCIGASVAFTSLILLVCIQTVYTVHHVFFRQTAMNAVVTPSLVIHVVYPPVDRLNADGITDTGFMIPLALAYCMQSRVHVTVVSEVIFSIPCIKSFMYLLGLKQILILGEYSLRIWCSDSKIGTRVLVKIT